MKNPIDTKEKLIKYIRSQLGAPLIEIEVNDEQISEIIDNVIQEFTEIAYGTLEATIAVQLKGKGEYQMPPNITNILKVSRGNTSNIMNFSLLPLGVGIFFALLFPTHIPSVFVLPPM